MTKLFASDLDGTLFNALHQSDPVINARLARVLKSGRAIALATGRTVRHPRDFGFGSLALYSVGANGAHIIDPAGHALRSVLLNQEALSELLRAFPDIWGDFPGIAHTYHLAANEQDGGAYLKSKGLLGQIMKRGRERMKRSGELVLLDRADQLLDAGIVKANLRPSSAAERAELEAFLAEHADTLVNASFDGDLFEITAAGVNKGEAVAWLASQLGVAEKNVCVYGDGGNDVAMLERFADSWVPKQARDSARAAAQHQIAGPRAHAVSRHMLRRCQLEGPCVSSPKLDATQICIGRTSYCSDSRVSKEVLL